MLTYADGAPRDAKGFMTEVRGVVEACGKRAMYADVC
jgi:hypothetical protein